MGWNGWMAIRGHRSSKSTFGAKCLLFTNTNFTRKNLFELFLSPQEMHFMSIQSLTSQWCKKMSKMLQGNINLYSKTTFHSVFW